MDNMLEMYLYETNTLLEQLDELLIEAEKNEEGIDWEKYIKHMESINIRQDKNDAPYSSENAVDFENMIRSTSNLYDYLIDELKYFKLT